MTIRRILESLKTLVESPQPPPTMEKIRGSWDELSRYLGSMSGEVALYDDAADWKVEKVGRPEFKTETSLGKEVAVVEFTLHLSLSDRPSWDEDEEEWFRFHDELHDDVKRQIVSLFNRIIGEPWGWDLSWNKHVVKVRVEYELEGK